MDESEICSSSGRECWSKISALLRMDVVVAASVFWTIGKGAAAFALDCVDRLGFSMSKDPGELGVGARAT